MEKRTRDTAAKRVESASCVSRPKAICTMEYSTITRIRSLVTMISLADSLRLPVSLQMNCQRFFTRNLISAHFCAHTNPYNLQGLQENIIMNSQESSFCACSCAFRGCVKFHTLHTTRFYRDVQSENKHVPGSFVREGRASCSRQISGYPILQSSTN